LLFFFSDKFSYFSFVFDQKVYIYTIIKNLLMRLTALKLTAVILLFCAFTSAVKAQVTPINVVTTAVPFLRISPDARSGGMGDIGLATSPDQYAGLWNAGKVAFNGMNGGVGATYTPWLHDLVNDVYLASLSGFYKFQDNQAVYGSLRYFSLGSIEFTNLTGAPQGKGSPREFGIDIGYSRKLNAKNGIGIALKYINSDLTNGFTSGSTTYKTGNSIAADLGWYHDGKKASGSGWTWGVTLSNLGAKVAYTNNADAKDFIPANLGLGTTYTKKYNDKNKITFGLDINKLLVPTPPVEGDAPGLAEYRNTSVISGWFKSFGDAPDGFSEELKEFQVSLGAEYWYNQQFALRAGYFYENKNKGNRRYFTAGLGLKYNAFGFNFAYLLPTGNGVSRNPLSNTLRFSISFDLGDGSRVKD
jgi:hypothetical protein